MVLIRWPDAIELCGYTEARHMTPALVESILVETEEAIGEPIRHTARGLFPKPLALSVQEEVELAWKAPKRSLDLCNKLSRPNHVNISADRLHHWASFRIRVQRNAPAALNVLTRVEKYASLSSAFFVRADSPGWWDSRAADAEKNQALAIAQLRIASDAGWSIAERLGWVNYFGSRASSDLGLNDGGSSCGAEANEPSGNGGRILWLTKAPFTFQDESHIKNYAQLLATLEPHRVKHGI